MNSVITEDFQRCFARLPDHVKSRARKAYQLWSQNHAHPSLQFKKIHASEPMFSIRVGLDWRALGLLEGETVTWFWIGSHAEYDQLLDRL